MSTLKELADYSYDRALAQKNLKEKHQGRLLIAYSGGMWIVDTQFLALLSLYADRDEVVLTDSNNIPRKIKPAELLEKAKQRHQEILNDWYNEYQIVSQIRTAKHV